MQDPTNEPPEDRGGFGSSPRQIVAEVGLIVGGLVVAVLGIVAIAHLGAGWLVRTIPRSVDVEVGRSAWSQYLEGGERCSDPAVERYVSELVAPLLEVMDTEGFDFQFAVLDDPSINAFALPGGLVTVHMGLLEAAETGEEVAAVLGHEIAHVTERHGMRRVVRQQAVAVLTGSLFGRSDLIVVADAVGSLMSLKYDRGQEREADEAGRAAMIEARIEPGGMERLFERLASEQPAGLPTFLSTHPDPGDRAARARADLGAVSEARMLATPSGLVCHAAEDRPPQPD
jgi:predicted Zn-dependent protease